MPSRKDQKNDTHDDGNLVAVDLYRVHDLMNGILRDWETNVIMGKTVLILDACNACNASELHQLMLVWPEEVLALAMHQVARSTAFMDMLFGENSEEIHRILDQLKEIRAERKEKEGRNGKGNSKEISECKDTVDKLLHKFRSAVH